MPKFMVTHVGTYIGNTINIKPLAQPMTVADDAPGAIMLVPKLGFVYVNPKVIPPVAETTEKPEEKKESNIILQ